MVCAGGGLVKPTAGPCPRANGKPHSDRMTRAKIRFFKPGLIFKSPGFPALRRTWDDAEYQLS
jgi:hypothetical protein